MTRHHKRVLVAQRALYILVSAARLSGPSASYSSREDAGAFEALLYRSLRRAKAFFYVHRSRVAPAARIYQIPGWASALFYSSGLAASSQLSIAWSHFLSASRRFCHLASEPSSEALSGELSTIFLSSYVSTALSKADDVEPLSLAKVALPEEGHRPVPLSRFLPWPWSEIFSDAFAKKLLHPTRSKIPSSSVPVYNSFASDDDKVGIYLALAARGMMLFRPLDPSSPLPENGVFGVKKSESATRLVVDNRRGNFWLLTMKELQRVYDDLLALYPDREVSVRIKILDLFNPASLTDLPPGGRLKTESDLSNFFHFLQAPDWMFDFQALSPVPASSLGLGDGWVVPIITTMAMGNVYAPLVAQLVHETLLLRSFQQTLSFRPSPAPWFDMLQRQASNGMVPLSSVPVPALKAFCLALKLDPVEVFRVADPDMMVPADAFSVLEAGGSAHPLRLRGVDLRDGDSRLVIASVPESDAVFGFVIYIDDQHSIFFGDSPRLGAMANARLLATTFIYAAAGLSSHPRKRVWASSSPSPTLGFVIDLSSPETEVGVAPAKLAALAARTLALVARVRTGSSLVTVGILQHLVSSWVWCFMIKRPLLSVFSKVFRKITLRPPHHSVHVSRSMCSELECAAYLAPVAFHVASPLSSTVAAFDASSAGYGVAVKRDCPEGVALELSARLERHGSWSAFSLVDGAPSDARLGGRLDPSFAVPAAEWLHHDWSSSDHGWKVARSGRWRSPAPRHITVGEARAGLMALHWLSGRVRDSLVIVCGDNQPCLGAFAKGRSSTWDVNVICRKICALSLATGILPRWLWLASEHNPSDRPSRWFRRDTMGWLRDIVRENGEAKNPGPPGGLLIRVGDRSAARISGPLGFAFASVAPLTAAGYLRAILVFTAWARHVGDSWAPLDAALVEYIYWCFDTGEASKTHCNYLLAGLGILRPKLKRRGYFLGARLAIRGWGRLVPSESHLPIPRSLLLGCAVELARRGRRHVAAALLLGFDCYLRHSDLKWLRVSDVSFPGDPRLQVPGLGAVFIFNTKAGRKQWVPVRCPLAIGLLRALVWGRRPSDFLFGPDRHGLLAGFRFGQRCLGIGGRFVMHSLRHGGASYDFIRGVPMDKIIIRGRWSGLAVTRRYIQESQALVLELSVPQAALAKVKLYTESEAVTRRWLGL